MSKKEIQNLKYITVKLQTKFNIYNPKVKDRNIKYYKINFLIPTVHMSYGVTASGVCVNV